MPKITPESAMQLIEDERAIVRVLRSDVSDYSDLLFELNQFADPENNRPLRPLDAKADRTQVYDFKLKTFVSRELKRKERGLPQPGNQRIKAVSGTLPPQDGNMRFYNHAKINQNHKHVIYGVDSGENPDRYLYLHKKDPTIEVKDEACLIVACFAKDAGTNTKWHIKGQPLNEYHEDRYPEAISFEQLKENNRAFVRTRREPYRHKDERNEVKFKPSVAALRFVGAVSNELVDLVNALHFKLLVWKLLKIDLPVLIFSDHGKFVYREQDQINDILLTFTRGIPFAMDIHDQIQTGDVPPDSIFEKYRLMFIEYREYVKHMRLLNSDINVAKFIDFYEAKASGSQLKQESKLSSVAETKDYKMAVLGRKQWSDIVSRTHAYHVANPLNQNKIIKKLKEAGVTGDLSKVIQDMCAYLQQNTRIVIAFNANEVMTTVPVSLRSLNLSEMNALTLKTDRRQHQLERSGVEEGSFSYLSDIKDIFSNSMQARPRYAYLTFINSENYPKPLTNNFGLSYFVLRDVIKLNSLFVPTNVFSNFRHRPESIKPCSYFHFDVLLSQASDTLFFGLVHAATGQLPDRALRNNENFEMQAYIPPVELFDQNCVERVYVSPDEYKMSDKETTFLEEHGITVCRQGGHAYADEDERLKQVMRLGAVSEVQRLLKQNPFLRYSLDRALKEGDFVTYSYFSQHDPEAKSVTWREMLDCVPIKKLELFHPAWSEAEIKALTKEDISYLHTFMLRVSNSNDQSVIKLFVSWLVTFNAASLAVNQFADEIKHGCDELVGTFFAKQLFGCLTKKKQVDSECIIAFLEAGLLQKEDVSREDFLDYDTLQTGCIAHRIFAYPQWKAVTRYLIEKKYYCFTGSKQEKEALVAGDNYIYFIHDISLVAKVYWSSERVRQAMQELLRDIDDVSVLETAFINMHIHSAFLNLSMVDKDNVLCLAAKKNPALLFIFTAILFENQLKSPVPHDVKHVVTQLIDTLKPLQGCESFIDYLRALSSKPDTQNREEKIDVQGFLSASSRGDWTVEARQGQFLMALEYCPQLLRNQQCIDYFCETIPSFDFLERSSRWSCAGPSIRAYFPDLLSTWLTKPHLFSFAQRQEMVVYAMHPLVARYANAKALIRFEPELMNTIVPGSKDTLLHLAIQDSDPDFAFIKRLMQSKTANWNNAKEQSVLFSLINERIASPGFWSGINNKEGESLLSACITEFLQTVQFSDTQLLAVLNHMVQLNSDVEACSVKICAAYKGDPAEEKALQASFITALKYAEVPVMKSMWKSYLQIKSMPQTAFREAIFYFIESKKSFHEMQDIHAILDCASAFDFTSIKDYLVRRSFNPRYLSFVLAHPRCRFDDPEMLNLIVTVFKESVFSSKKIAIDIYFSELVEAYLIFFKRVGRLDKLKESKDYGLYMAKENLFSTLNVFLQYQFSLCHETWHIVLHNFAAGDPGHRQSLIAIIKTQPERMREAWDYSLAHVVSNTNATAKISDSLSEAKQRFSEAFTPSVSLNAEIDKSIREAVDKLTLCNEDSMREMLSAIKRTDLAGAIRHCYSGDFGKWMYSHRELIKESTQPSFVLSATLDEMSAAEQSQPLDVRTGKGLNQVIAAISLDDLVLMQDAKAQLKRLIEYQDVAMMAHYYDLACHATFLWLHIKTHYVLCRLEQGDDGEFTSLRLKQYCLMMKAIDSNKDKPLLSPSNFYSAFYQGRNAASIEPEEKANPNDWWQR